MQCGFKVRLAGFLFFVFFTLVLLFGLGFGCQRLSLFGQDFGLGDLTLLGLGSADHLFQIVEHRGFIFCGQCAYFLGFLEITPKLLDHGHDLKPIGVFLVVEIFIRGQSLLQAIIF